mgnify:CR=1 FL=1
MLDRFAKLLGIRPDQAEDALHSERAAKHVVSRRSFLGVGAALATGAIFSFGAGGEVAERAITVARPGSMLTSFDKLLKGIYSDGRIGPLVYRDSPFFGMAKITDADRQAFGAGLHLESGAEGRSPLILKAGDSTPMSGRT